MRLAHGDVSTYQVWCMVVWGTQHVCQDNISFMWHQQSYHFNDIKLKDRWNTCLQEHT